jgi:hypothetical protein
MRLILAAQNIDFVKLAMAKPPGKTGYFPGYFIFSGKNLSLWKQF